MAGILREKHMLEMHWLNYSKPFHLLYVLSSNVYFSYFSLGACLGLFLSAADCKSPGEVLD